MTHAAATDAASGIDQPPPGAVTSAAIAAVGATLFLSYSRADSAFLRRLAQAMEEAGYRPNYDTAESSLADADVGISAQDEWWTRLEEMIVAADVTILVVSPDSAVSEVVDKEIEFARDHGKRIIPVLCRPVDFASATPRVAALNVKISFVDQSPDAFAASLTQLCGAVDEDIDWLRRGRALTQKAREWHAANESRDRLLYGEAIAEAERWAARRPPRAPSISEALTTFIAASRAWERELARKEHAQSARQRRMRSWIGRLLAAGTVLLLAGTAAGLNRQRKIARSESLMFARVGDEAFTRGDYVRAARLGAHGALRDVLRPGSTEADSVFGRAMRSPMLERELPTKAGITHTWADSQGRYAAAVEGGGYRFGLWRIETEELIASIEPADTLAEVDFTVSPDGRRFLYWATDLKSPFGFSDGPELDRARLATLLTVDAAGNVVERRRQRYPIAGGLLSSGNRPIVTWGGRRLTAWSADFTERLAEVGLPSSVEIARGVGDGRRVVLALDAGRVEVWSIDGASRTGAGVAVKRVATGRVGAVVRELLPLPEENLILAITEADELVALELETLAVRYRGITQRCCDISPEMRRVTLPSLGGKQWVLVAVATTEGAQAIRLTTGERVGPKMAHIGIRGARFDPAGERVVTFGFDSKAYVWDFASGARRAELNQSDARGSVRLVGPPDGIRGAAFLPEGNAILAWNGDGTIRVHDASTGEQIGGHMRHDYAIQSVLLLPGRRVMTAAAGPIRIWRRPDYAAPIATVSALCESDWPSLRFVHLTRTEAGGAALSSAEQQNGRARLAPGLRVDREDVQLAPLMRARESEDLCASR